MKPKPCSGCGRIYNCRDYCSTRGTWPAESYRKVQQFTPAEEYMVEKLAERPTLSAALDNLYRRNPRRWHQVVRAAMLTRAEAVV